MKIYIICPVRHASEDVTKRINDYVDKMEDEGHDVHFPPRDVEQNDPTGGYVICTKHGRAMYESDEVHIFWDRTSTGSHFDLGMAFFAQKRIRLVEVFGDDSEGKSYLKIIQKVERDGYNNI